MDKYKYNGKIMKNNAFFCIKAYGDLTIILNAIQLLREKDQKEITCIVGGHHKDLVKALKPKCNIIILQSKSNKIPAFYDIRDSGIIMAISNLLVTMVQIRSQKLDSYQLIFDRIGFREKILSIGHSSIKINDEINNIYINYRNTLEKIYQYPLKWKEIESVGNKIFIFPNGRKSYRNIPENQVEIIAKFCERYGFKPIIYELDNERSIEIKNINKIRTQPSFENSIKIIKNSCAIISCDSLPVHLSSYFGRPVFVMSPYTKTNYWLPENSFQNHYWNLFGNIDELLNSLSKFLIRIKK